MSTNRLMVTTALAILFLLSGCEKRLDNYRFLKVDPKLVVNAPVYADSTIIIHISEPIEILEPDRFTWRDDAVAELYRDGSLVSTGVHSDTGFYTFDYLPVPGDQLTFEIEAPGLPAVSTEVDIPAQPEFVSLEVVGEDIEFGTRVRLTLRDNGSVRNYYGISIWRYSGYLEYDIDGHITDTIYDGFSPTFLTSSDLSVTGGITYYRLSSAGDWQENISGTTLLIEDHLFNGRNLEIDFYLNDAWYFEKIGSPFFVVLEAYSEEYIYYLRSLEMYYENDGNPIAEAVTIYSNIKGGLGLAYGKSVTRVTLPPSVFEPPSR